ncbi:Six-hairpin glycosidase [Akanthomyces lecanii RCEF 1005]|uniref:Six-hairpin glycosidase n=1 Tax=Akanthomyces lecanii RCEF 1005 TaxID=1081108 RepID=A0A168AY07_CORDF|nr:Six-hairpin glycosidase [Akanthomyces lecanii RCEF 1005]
MSPSTLPVAMSSNGSTKSDENQNGIDEMKQKLKVQTGLQSVSDATYSNQAMGADDISRLFSDNAILKIWKTAVEHLTREDPPQSFPETCPQTGPKAGQYLYRDAEFWTCGFFPGSVYCLLERSIRYPQAFMVEQGGDADLRERLRSELLTVCRRWAEPLHEMSNRKDTHDIGFIVEPALRRDFELTGDMRSLKSIVNAADSLASRYSETTQAIRSWDRFVNNGNNFVDQESEFLVIIDSMCNLDLLYYAGHHASSQRLIDIATTHAHTIRETHLRPEPSAPGAKYPTFSTCHVANMCPKTGNILQRLTAQGYSDTSTWSRGQAWAILGFAQTYTWTKDETFLRTACGLADYFILRLASAPSCVDQTQQGVRAGRHVPLWDFDAPVDEDSPLRDTSAAMIAANGMLLIANSVATTGDFELFEKYYKAAMAIVTETIALCYAQDTLNLVRQENGVGSVSVVARQPPDCAADSFECILKCATANFNENWTDKYADHGLVYADYYLLEFGNRLLQFGYA